MICRECGSDRFSVVRVWRDRKYSDEGEMSYNSLFDVRRVVCNGCGKMIITETVMKCAEEYDKKTMKMKRIKPQDITRRIERDDQLF